MTDDPITAFESLGYTKREAAFLYLVGVHSGYFLRRQFDYFIDRFKGAVAANFLARACAAGHVTPIAYPQGWRVYHLCSRTIYRILGDPENPNRRRKADAHIRTRLLTLDYVLENDTEEYFDTDEKKICFLRDCRGIPESLFLDSGGRLHSALRSVTLSVVDGKYAATCLVRAMYADRSTLVPVTLFRRVLEGIGPAMRALGTAEIIFASCSAYKFELAEEEFCRQFDQVARNPQSMLSENSFGRCGTSTHPEPNGHVEFTTILFRSPYPQRQNNEARCSVRGSIIAS
jgi:hypothetical protein